MKKKHVLSHQTTRSTMTHVSEGVCVEACKLGGSIRTKVFWAPPPTQTRPLGRQWPPGHPQASVLPPTHNKANIYTEAACELSARTLLRPWRCHPRPHSSPPRPPARRSSQTPTYSHGDTEASSVRALCAAGRHRSPEARWCFYYEEVKTIWK